MRLIIGAIVAVVGGIALASGVTVAVNLSSAPDKGINVEEARTPDPWAGATDYGTP